MVIGCSSSNPPRYGIFTLAEEEREEAAGDRERTATAGMSFAELRVGRRGPGGGPRRPEGERGVRLARPPRAERRGRCGVRRGLSQQPAAWREGVFLELTVDSVFLSCGAQFAFHLNLSLC